MGLEAFLFGLSVCLYAVVQIPYPRESTKTLQCLHLQIVNFYKMVRAYNHLHCKKSPICSRGDPQTISRIVNSCSLTKFELTILKESEDDGVS